MTNAEIARVFARIATMLEMEGANPFRVRAYREGARVIESQPEAMTALAGEEGRLEALHGIGKDLASKIRDVATTGTTPVYEELKKRIPLDVVALTELQGLGPKRVKTVFDALGVRNREDLERAAKAGKLRDLPGFGEKVEQNVLKALATASAWSGRILLAAAWPVAHDLAARIAGLRGVGRVEIAGSFRRRKETVGDLDLLACGGASDEVMDTFTKHGTVAEILGRGETKSSVRLSNGLQVDLRLVPAESFGAALVYFTGSKEHNIELRKIAIERGLSLNEYGLTRGERLVAGRTEEDVYAELGMKWIPPELREAGGEIELARFYELPALIEERDLRADLHMHTDRSDGRDTLEAMVRAAKARGYAYCAITEHSKSLTVARGFDEARVQRSVAEIEAVRGLVPGIEVLHGLEVDILADGSLDLGDDALDLLDWVIVSLHSRLDQPAPAMNERVLRALSHPAVHAMGHPTGRLIGTREGAALDFERIFRRAAEAGVAMEINAQPDRTDLDAAHARLARDAGVRIVIDTDAHSTVQLDQIRFGVFAARRAGLTKRDVLNALPVEAFREALHRPGRPVAAGAASAGPPRGTIAPPVAAEAEPAVAAGTRASTRPAAQGRPKGGKQSAPVPRERAARPASAGKPAGRRSSTGAPKPAAGARAQPASRARVKPASRARTKPAVGARAKPRKSSR
jgi:DNA polymerase (family 10)